MAEPSSATTPSSLFLTEGAKLQQHIDFLRVKSGEYKTELFDLINKKILLTAATKARIYAACWAAKEKDLLTQLEAVPEFFTIVELLKAVKLLDAPRRIRQLEKKLLKLQEIGAKPRTITKTKNAINELSDDVHTESCGASGALARRVRKWTKASFNEERLNFFLMQFPTLPWKQLADVVHLAPSSFASSYFLPACFGADVSAESPLVDAMQKLNVSNITELLTDQPELCNYYSTIRTKIPPKDIPQEALLQLVRKAPLDVVLWWYEELDPSLARMAKGECPVCGVSVLRYRLQRHVDLCLSHQNDSSGGDDDDDDEEENKASEKKGADKAAPVSAAAIVSARLESEGLQMSAGFSGRSNYAKLMERILFFRQHKLAFASLLMPIAEQRLDEVTLGGSTSMTSVVIGDASGSMEVAVRVATIIGSLLSVYLKADLCFFNGKRIVPPVVPRTAQQVVDVCEATQATGCTAPAAALYHYYAAKIKVDLFVMVTDEEENTKSNGFNFAPLFKKYKQDVNPNVQLLFVSFLPINTTGQMVRDLDRLGITPIQFALDKNRPDLSKFDSLLGILSRLRTDNEASAVSSSSSGVSASAPSPVVVQPDQSTSTTV